MGTVKVVKKRGKFFAYVKGFWNKTVVTGDLFELLTDAEQHAVMAHEMGHIVGSHMRQRWALFLKFDWLAWDDFAAKLRAQELQADEWAARTGHAAGMISALRHMGAVHDRMHYVAEQRAGKRIAREDNPLYPSTHERILRIQQLFPGA